MCCSGLPPTAVTSTGKRTEPSVVNTAAYLAFLAVSTAVIVVPGPSILLIVANTLAAGARAGLYTVAGTSIAMALQLTVAVAGLTAWASKNRPEDGKRIITEAEITEQAECAYRKEYRACGCEEPTGAPYCEPGCPVNEQKMRQCSDVEVRA